MAQVHHNLFSGFALAAPIAPYNGRVADRMDRIYANGMRDEKTTPQAIDLPSSPLGVVNTTSSQSFSILVSQNQADYWKPVGYELDLFRAARNLNTTQALAGDLKNIVVESLLLHTRNLCELFLPDNEKRPDDIRLTYLFDDWKTSDRYRELKRLVDNLLVAYGKSGDEGSLRTALNKRLAHLTRRRAEALGYDYTPKFAPLEPLIENIFVQIEQLRAAAYA